MIKLLLTCLILCSSHFKPAFPYEAGISKINQPEKAKVIQRVTEFLKWYKINQQRVNNFQILAKDAEGFYLVDKKASSNYLDFLRSSSFISAKYIGYWQRFFDDKAELLKTEKIKEGKPEDFDMEFILMTQDPGVVLNHISKLKYNVVSLNSKTALIRVTLPADKSIQYKFEMINTRTGWQIEYISTANYD